MLMLLTRRQCHREVVPETPLIYAFCGFENFESRVCILGQMTGILRVSWAGRAGLSGEKYSQNLLITRQKKDGLPLEKYPLGSNRKACRVRYHAQSRAILVYRMYEVSTSVDDFLKFTKQNKETNVLIPLFRSQFGNLGNITFYFGWLASPTIG